VIAFDQVLGAALMELSDKDAVAVAGSLTVSAWLDKEGKPRPGLDLVAHQLLTPYSVGRRRKAMRQQAQASPDPRCTEIGATAAQHEELNDALPF